MLMELLMVFLLLNIVVCTSVKCGHGGLVSLYVGLGDVCIDLVHGGSVGPAADLHSDTLRHLQVIGQGSEAVTQVVNAHVRKVMLPADLLDGAAKAVLSDVQHGTCWLAVPLDGCCQLRDHHRHVAGGGGVFILRLPLVFVVLVEDHRALHPDEIRIVRDIVPLQSLDL